MSTSTQPPALTANDTTILSLLFDPESSSSSTTSSTITIDPTLPDHPTIPPSILATLRRRELVCIKKAERAFTLLPSGTVTSSEVVAEGDLERDRDVDEEEGRRLLEESLDGLKSLVAEHPTYASGWNNLAQVRRLRIQLLDQHHPQTISEDRLIESHIRRAIELATPTSPSADQPAAISPSTAKTLQAAYNQLGTVYLSWSKSRELEGDGSATDWEEKASRAFSMAGRYGSEIGKVMAARTNPYAKMCASMVREVMKREVVGEMGA